MELLFDFLTFLQCFPGLFADMRLILSPRPRSRSFVLSERSGPVRGTGSGIRSPDIELAFQAQTEQTCEYVRMDLEPSLFNHPIKYSHNLQ